MGQDLSRQPSLYPTQGSQLPQGRGNERSHPQSSGARLTPGSILTLQGPEPLCSPRPRRAGLFVCLPSTSSEGAGGRQSAGNAAEEACGFIWRLHNGTFTQRLAGGNWVDECLVMPPVQRVNSQDLAYIISREHLRPLLCLFPGALWHRCIPGSFCACRFPNKPAHLLGPRPR